MTSEQKTFLQSCREQYLGDLTGDIMPFWLRHGLDREHGGVYTCLDREGRLMDPTKSVWFQGRFGYICAAACNRIERRTEWLAASKSCIDFIERHCIDTDGHMFFTVAADGRPVQKRRYVFSECFAAAAMAEYALASGDMTYARRALELFHATRRMLATPGFLPPKTTVEGRSHSITMILINVALVIRQVIDDAALDEQIAASLHEIEHYLMHPEYRTVLETVAPDGSLIDTCAGRTINPGHCIETAWFILDAARAERDPARRDHYTQIGLRILDWGWEWGWDDAYGGIINFRDCRNFPPQDYSQDMKFWWPQCEAIVAALYAYRVSGDEKYLEMHRRAHEWAYAHLQDRECGEWYGYLHRDGSVAQPAKGNIFKGPFHVPRMMIRSKLLCDEILDA
ncbi:AGE family epimerase/isomerase [uncultured Alistipes sp.]|uniref:AGE family epimerase/isomerase n=1 Tax=uncultured Alistipes sp. TaxID=538949 RepID=UPI002612B13A|nr:AGE family epimerase/isomerase [uncultured Alistipes sp.]